MTEGLLARVQGVGVVAAEDGEGVVGLPPLVAVTLAHPRQEMRVNCDLSLVQVRSCCHDCNISCHDVAVACGLDIYTQSV